MKAQCKTSYEEIVSLENLFAAWQEFRCGKTKKRDVREFGSQLTDYIVQLHHDLANFTYVHGPYTAFHISDPKPRHIHKAVVRDRVVHHAIYRTLYPFFDTTFIADSYSCRNGKGTYKALNRFRTFGRKVSKNNTRTAWVLKCDIKKFFASIDHSVLLAMLAQYIPNQNNMWLLRQVINSFCTQHEGKGLPLGNLTSQLFCNVYMNEFDQFVKHALKCTYYIRYADDFVFLSESKNELLALLPQIAEFLEATLKLSLHSDKVFIKTMASGIDFLGWAHFPFHRVLRPVTKRRMFKRVYSHPTYETLQSYLGFISNGNSYGLQQELLNWGGLLAEHSFTDTL